MIIENEKKIKKKLRILIGEYSNCIELDLILDRMISEFITIDFSSKEIMDDSLVMHHIIINPPGRGKGKTTKIKNISLNLSKLYDSAAVGVFAGVSTSEYPWLFPFGIILLWNSLLRASEIELSEKEGVILYTMWFNRNKNNEVLVSGLKDLVNKTLLKFDQPALKLKNYDFAIKNLLKLGCIKLIKNETQFSLIEFVEINWA